MKEQERRKKSGVSFKQIIGGGVLSNRVVVTLIPYLIYIFIWTVVYVLNGHWGQSVVVRKNELSKEVQELQVEATAVKVELEKMSLETEILKKVEETGLALKLPNVPNREINIEKEAKWEK
ncbi:MAG: FtsL-like putative cell division protein [Bacteroidales bacterium]